jgi:hypothetical protein
MNTTKLHTFHIPVMGLGFTIDTPIKVARFGISSVISIIEDELIEQVREFHSKNSGREYIKISDQEEDYRARRITAYLNLVNEIVNEQIAKMRTLPFEEGNELCKYFELLPDSSSVKKMYRGMMMMSDPTAKEYVQNQLRDNVIPGSIDVNIMSKLDKQNYSKSGEALPVEYCDAMAALRGFAKSDLASSVVFSAGYNPRLYAYVENFPDFFPDKTGYFKKKIILKVSDFRSALIQGKTFAKKGLFVSEFRIESGLNCGGHAFPTEGFLLGPILEEFKEKRTSLNSELINICNQVWKEKGIVNESISARISISAQGGIGTASENDLLLKHYEIDSTGWGSPFLLVPEATNVDEETMNQLANAKKSDYFLSYASPLGIPFNNFKPSSSETQRLNRIQKGRPGSPCYKKFLSSNTEFTEKPICTASREYQHLKIKRLGEQALELPVYKKELDKVMEKDCLCEGLGTSVLIKNKLDLHHKLKAVTICPGPNLAYFSKISSLYDMVSHIYGRINILNSVKRPNIFVNELILYTDYLKKEISNSSKISINQNKYFQNFKANLLNGIEYYRSKLPIIVFETQKNIDQMFQELKEIKSFLENLIIPEVQPVLE